MDFNRDMEMTYGHSVTAAGSANTGGGGSPRPERRLLSRFNRYFPVRIRRAGRGPEMDAGERAFTVNIASRGAFLLIKGAWRVGRICSIELWGRSADARGGGRPAFASLAMIERVEELKDDPLSHGGYHGVAVLFDDLLDLTRLGITPGAETT